MTSLFPYLILGVLFVRGITLEGSVQGIIYYLKPEFHRLLSAQVSYHLLPETETHFYTDWSSSTLTRVPQVLFCTGQWGGTQKSTLSPQILGTIGSSMIAKSLFKWCNGVITLHGMGPVPVQGPNGNYSAM